MSGGHEEVSAAARRTRDNIILQQEDNDYVWVGHPPTWFSE